jgi:uncharacterized membrane protein required for colicin V production
VIVDILIAVCLAGSVVLGYRYGLFRRLVQVAAFALGLILARGMSVAMTQNFGLNVGKHPVAAHLGIFIGIVLAVVIMAEVLMAFYSGPLAFFNALLFDRFFGAAAGLLFSAVELSILLYIFSYGAATQGPGGTGQPQIVDSFTASISQSILAGPLKAIQPAVVTVFRPVLPLEPAKYFASSFS